MLAPIATLTEPELANEVQTFFASHDVPQGARTLAQHLEKLKVNVALAERERPVLKEAVN
jgi:hypothetical protein